MPLPIVLVSLGVLGFSQAQKPPAPKPVPPAAPVIGVEIDGRAVQFRGTPPRSIAGRLMVPMRTIFEALGAYVEYSAPQKLILARMGTEEIELRIGDKLAKKNGAELMMDVPPSKVDGTVMVPLRFVVESLGADVEFLKSENKIKITTSASEPPSEPPLLQ